MYATAQRVAHSGNHQDGINAFVHEHGIDFPWPNEPWHLPNNNPGTLRLSHIEVPPGGNTVISYLDVLCPDITSAANVKAALDALWLELLADELGPSSPFGLPNPLSYQHGNVCLTYSVNIADETSRRIEYDSLSQQLLRLLGTVPKGENPESS